MEYVNRKHIVKGRTKFNVIGRAGQILNNNMFYRNASFLRKQILTLYQYLGQIMTIYLRVKEILFAYDNALGQAIHLSEFGRAFSSNVPQNTCINLVNMLIVTNV